MIRKDGFDRLLDFIANDDSEEDDEEGQVVVPSMHDEEENVDEDEEDYDSKELKFSSFVRSTIMNNKILIMLVMVCLGASFALAHVRLTMKDTSIQNTILSEHFHDSVINKHNLEQLINAQSNFPKVDSVDATLQTHRHTRENSITEEQSQSIPVVESKQHNDLDGCVYEIPDPDYRQHIVKPPEGPVTLVCCNTTKGPLTMEVHPSWAPIGAKRFLDMVKDGFFSTKVPLFRALKDFLVQFGLAGDPEVQKRYHEMGNLKDDPPWLPLGPPGREINGIKRYQKGYLGYAGAGKDSRGTQLIMAFVDSLYLGGGSPWEVPFGQIVGERSFETMSKIYTGYGEKPSQGKIMNRGAKYIEEEFPFIDFILSCSVIRENVPWNYQGKTGK